MLRDRLPDKETSSVDIKIMREWGNDRACMESRKAETVNRIFTQYFSDQPVGAELKRIVPAAEKLVNFEKIMAQCSDSIQIEEWSERMTREIKKAADLSDEEIRLLISVGIQARIGRDPLYKKLYVRHLSHCLSGKIES